MKQIHLPSIINQNSIMNGPILSEIFGIEGKMCKKILETLENARNTEVYHSNYNNWKKHFLSLYPGDELKPDLFHKHILLMSAILMVFKIQQTYFSHNGKTDLNQIENTKKEKYDQILITDILQIPSYLNWVFEISEIINEIDGMTKLYQKYQIKSTDLFFELYQSLLFDNTRHQMGEFYTHSQLAELMVNEVYRPGISVLDPACGSGMFLLSISNSLINNKFSDEERFRALNRICGIDRNPIACIMARTNLLLQNYDLKRKFNWHPNILEQNSLLIPSKDVFSIFNISIGFDLIIGNPPWVVLNRLSDKKEKEQVKQLGKELGILCGGKLATSTELTTSFIARMIRDFLAPDGYIFFVTPASLASGAQHEKFRNFHSMKNVEFWAFDKDIFKIHNLCFKAQKSSEKDPNKIEVIWKLFHCELDPIKVQLKSSEIYTPQSIRTDSKTNERLIGRLGKKTLDFVEENSYYHVKFRQGASLVPRNLLFIEIVEKNANIIRFKPAETIQNKKYRTWEFDAFKTAEVEEEYIFKVAKSTGIMPFHYELSDWAFLPLNTINHNLIITAPKAVEHLRKLEKLFIENMKEGAEIQSLLKRLDYGRALSDERQLKSFKIIYGGIGSIVKAAILRECYIIDTSLYYYLPESEEEAYFLLGYLNSNYITQYVKKVGSTGANGSLRNIHKHPLDLGLPRFEIQNENHLMLSNQARQMENYVNNFITNQKIESNKMELTLKMIQKRLFLDQIYQRSINELDEIVKKIIISYYSV